MGLALAATIAMIALLPTSGRAEPDAAQVTATPPPSLTPPKRPKTPRKTATPRDGEVRLERGTSVSLAPPAQATPLRLSLPPTFGLSFPSASGKDRPLSRNPLPSDASAASPPGRAAVIDDAPLQETQITPVLRSEKPFIPNVDTSGLRQKGIELQLRTPF